AVQLLGADVVTVERGGPRRTVRPRARWLAVCRSADVGRVSRHLLDRFAVRLSAAGLRLPGVREALAEPGPGPQVGVAGEGEAREELFAGLPAAWRSAAEGAIRPVPVGDAAII
ncbi:magnesium chelatase, partial [Streptomyces sp. SID5926]|nr:magnesium chelatase [Streptomyces sp. SID5926]